MILAVLFMAAAAVRPFPEERELLDRRLETLRRILPDGPNPHSDVALVSSLAEAAHLTGVEVNPRPPLESAARGEIALELQATGRFTDVDRFFRQAAVSHRLIDVEGLTLSPTPEGLVKVTTVLRVPYRPLKAPLPPAPDDTAERAKGAGRAAADTFTRDQAMAVSKSEAIAGLRRTRRNPRLFFAELAAIVQDRPVVLTHVTLGEEFLVRGLCIGEGPTRALEARFERGYFRLSDFTISRQGACRRFEAKGRSPVVGADAELAAPVDDPFVPDDAPCVVDRDAAARTHNVRFPTGKTPTKGPLTLHLRGVDAADAFFILHTLTGDGFLVDGDVRGRVWGDVVRASFDETMSALARSPLRVSLLDGLRRISLGTTPEVSPPGAGPAPDAPRVSFSVKRGDVRELLTVMGEADPALAGVGPKGPLGRLSVWVRDRPLAQLRQTVLESAGLVEASEGEQRAVRRLDGAADEALVPITAVPPERRLVMRASDMAVYEFDLVGTASADDGWRAYAYSPSGALLTYRAGDRLADGTVRSVSENDVWLDTEEGPVRVPLP